MSTQLVLNKYNTNYEALRLAELTALAFNLGKILLKLPRVISELIRDELASFSKVTLDRNESFAASRNQSYTTLFSYQQRQENKAKLAC